MSKLKKKTYKNPLNTISILLFIFYTVIYFMDGDYPSYLWTGMCF